VEQTLQTNYYGTLAMTQGVLPLLKRSAHSRIVNVSSMLGKLNKYSPAVTAAFRSATTVAHMTQLMRDFHTAVAAGTHTAQGWPTNAYAVSKAGVTGLTHVLAAESAAAEGGRGGAALINACCPGYVKTDMTRGRGRKTPDHGAATPVLLALGDLAGQTGAFWEHEEVSRW